MQSDEIIKKLKESGLTGRSGAGFSVGDKWEIVKNQKSDRKFVVCNGSEGEPGVFKDKYILDKYPDEVIKGINLAIEAVGATKAYVYINSKYYKKFKKSLEKLFFDSPIEIFEDKFGYLSGEETALCEVIEGKRPVVRKKPPFPCQSGIWSFPTLINNVETLYYVSKVIEDDYQNNRFYCVSGDVSKEGVWEFSCEHSIRKILEETGNYPDFDFFVQVGGGACGEIMLPSELDKSVKGTGSIIVFDKSKTDLNELMKKWVDFFMQENCDKCVPCREGTYRIREMLEKGDIDKEVLNDLFFSLEQSSFCALGRGVSVPFRSLINKIL